MLTFFRHHPAATTNGLLMFAAATWGLFWIPLRYLRDAGFEGAWSTVAYFGVCVVVLLPWQLTRWRRLGAGGRAMLLAGAVAGAAIALYTLSFLFTTVTKALLIFYLTPVWSALAARLMLREAITPARYLALIMGLAGLWVILGADGVVPMPSNPGDWMALASGMVWAYAAVCLHRSDAAPTEWVTVFMVSGFVVSVICLCVSPDLQAVPSLDRLGVVAMLVLLGVACVSLPMNGIILWATHRLSPVRVGLIMLLEVVVGIAVAAILTDEPYGLREALGTLLIIGAAVVDIWQFGVARDS